MSLNVGIRRKSRAFQIHNYRPPTPPRRGCNPSECLDSSDSSTSRTESAIEHTNDVCENTDPRTLTSQIEGKLSSKFKLRRQISIDTRLLNFPLNSFPNKQNKRHRNETSFIKKKTSIIGPNELGSPSKTRSIFPPSPVHHCLLNNYHCDDLLIDDYNGIPETIPEGRLAKQGLNQMPYRRNRHRFIDNEDGMTSGASTSFPSSPSSTPSSCDNQKETYTPIPSLSLSRRMPWQFINCGDNLQCIDNAYDTTSSAISQSRCGLESGTNSRRDDRDKVCVIQNESIDRLHSRYDYFVDQYLNSVAEEWPKIMRSLETRKEKLTITESSDEASDPSCDSITPVVTVMNAREILIVLLGLVTILLCFKVLYQCGVFSHLCG